MKQKIFIFIFLIIFLLTLTSNTFGVFAQDTASPKSVPRVVLVELFVQGSCLSCPTAEFCLEDLAWEYGTSKLILVEEHLWGDGYDTTETNARYNWYVDVDSDKRGTPDVFINGLTKRLYGLACDCVEGNYTCYKEAIDKELTEPPLVELSAVKTPHPNPLPQGEREKTKESPQGEKKEGEESPQGEKKEGEESPQGEKEVEKVLNIIIEGRVKNISDTPLKDLAVCGMVSKERDESGLYCYAQDIFPFQDIPLLLPDHTFNFKFTSEISLDLKSEIDGEEEVLHLVIFVQNTETKEILQALYIE
jgi:hypothetical protein